MSRYRKVENKSHEERINEIYGDELGNFYCLISIKNYEAHIKSCGDVSCGIPAMLNHIFRMAEDAANKGAKFNIDKFTQFVKQVYEEGLNDNNQ